MAWNLKNRVAQRNHEMEVFKVNNEIIRAMNQARVYRWEIAEKLGISEPTFYRWLRRELPPEKRESVLQAIEQIKAQREGG